MRFQNVCIESIAAALPEEVWTSTDIEERLRPLYERLRLPFGRLELMSGIRERRVWPPGTRASDASAAAGRAVLARSAGPRHCQGRAARDPAGSPEHRPHCARHCAGRSRTIT